MLERGTSRRPTFLELLGKHSTCNNQRRTSNGWNATPSRPHPGPNLGLAPLPCPRERETSFPPLSDWQAMDWRRFRGSMHEFFMGNLSPFCSADSAKRGEG